MKINLIPIIAAILFFSCSKYIEHKSPKANNDLFAHVKILNFPFSYNCGDEFSSTIVNDLNLDHQYQKIAGKIILEDGLIGILYFTLGDIFWPFLVVYKENCEKVGSTGFFEGACGGEENYFESEHLYIDKEKIIVTDSLLEWEIDEEYDKIANSENLTVSKKVLVINKDGSIVLQ